MSDAATKHFTIDRVVGVLVVVAATWFGTDISGTQGTATNAFSADIIRLEKATAAQAEAISTLRAEIMRLRARHEHPLIAAAEIEDAIPEPPVPEAVPVEDEEIDTYQRSRGLK